MASDVVRDAYGFEVKKEHLHLFKEYSPLWHKEEKERTQRWAALLLSFAALPLAEGRRQELLAAHSSSEALQDLLNQCCLDGLLDSRCAPSSAQQLRTLVQAGIPGGFRARIWQSFLGARDEADATLRAGDLGGDDALVGHPQLQEPLTADGLLEAQIDKDLHRTFPGHPLMDQEGRAQLRQVLCAYGARNPSVGYCQGMNFIAGGLLLFLDLPDAFACLCTVVEELLPGYFRNEMIVPQVDQLVFRHLVEEAFPRLASHLEGLGAHVAGVSTQWFLCLFVNSLPLETCFRVWDVFFQERCVSTLFRVGLALVDIYSQALLCTKDSIAAFSLLQHMAPLSYDSSRLIDVACIAFSHVDGRKIESLRSLYEGSVREATKDDSGGFAPFGQPVAKSAPSNVDPVASAAQGPPVPIHDQLFSILAKLQEEVASADARCREVELELWDVRAAMGSVHSQLGACSSTLIEKEHALAALLCQARELECSLGAESASCTQVRQAVEKQAAVLSRKESLLGDKELLIHRLLQRTGALSRGFSWQAWART